jgi:hypothetical protein
MIKKPVKKDYSSFSFMNPLSEEIWLLIVFSYTLVSFVMYIVSRWSPSETRLLSGQLLADVPTDQQYQDEQITLALPPPPPPPPRPLPPLSSSLNGYADPNDLQTLRTSLPTYPSYSENDSDQMLFVNDFNLINSMWFALGAIMQQGVDVCPR